MTILARTFTTCLVFSAWVAGQPAIPTTEGDETYCAQQQVARVEEQETCYNNAAGKMYMRFITPDAGTVGENDFDPDAARDALKKATKAFKKANKSCTKQLKKSLNRLKKNDCPDIKPKAVSNDMRDCIADDESFGTCLEEIKEELLPSTETGTDGSEVLPCCPLGTKPGHGTNPECPDGNEPKCCPQSSNWGCGSEGEVENGYYVCPDLPEPVFMGKAEAGTLCNSITGASTGRTNGGGGGGIVWCDRSIQVQCPDGRFVYPDEDCYLDC